MKYNHLPAASRPNYIIELREYGQHGHCAICGAYTHFADVNLNAYICSEECDNSVYNEASEIPVKYNRCPTDVRCPTYQEKALSAVADELERATTTYDPMRSAHEGYAILKEEVDELWTEIKAKPEKRSTVAMRNEAIQVAAMAIRFLIDICITDNVPALNIPPTGDIPE